MPVPCARCELPLARFEYEAGGTATCTPCGARNTVLVFPALLAPAASARAEAALAGEAACFEHPAKRRPAIEVARRKIHLLIPHVASRISGRAPRTA